MSGDSWKLTLPCTRAEAEAIADAEFGARVALITTEEDEAAERWRLDAYFEGAPDADVIAAVCALVPSAAGQHAAAAPVADQDWLALSQAGLEPVRAGRFLVHTGAQRIDVPAGTRAFHIAAGRAFGTGHHETTAGCLTMLDRLASDGAVFENAIDLGTGTGLLAFAALHLWPQARGVATDIDPIAIDVSRDNAALNAVPEEDEPGAVLLLVADGADDPAIAARAPYDLVIANILAPPLIAIAAEVAAICTPGATIVLAGLLSRQADAVEDAYRAAGCRPLERLVRGDWSILRLEAGALPSTDTAPAGDRGAWWTES